MTVLNASDPAQLSVLVSVVEAPDAWLVACLCAAWCKTCDEYRPTFDALAALHPTWAFAWIDIEDESELVGDHDVEDFPTLVVQHGDDVLFIGGLTPHKLVAQRLLESLAEGDPSAVDSSLDLRARLLDR